MNEFTNFMRSNYLPFFNDTKKKLEQLEEIKNKNIELEDRMTELEKARKVQIGINTKLLKEEEAEPAPKKSLIDKILGR